MKIISAEFVTSAAAGGSTQGIPNDGLPQIAMAGRSNVGKSALLNALCRQKIARTSAAPGKTRLANVYRVTVEGLGPGKRSLYLVDLPGYGYARGGADAAQELRAVAEAYLSASRTPVARHFSGASDDAAEHWKQQLGRSNRSDAPLKRRATSVVALLLVDSRHPGLDSDIQAAEWLASMNVEYRLVATKIDKLSRTERARHMKTLERTFGTAPLAVSAASGEGMDALWKTIASLATTGHA